MALSARPCDSLPRWNSTSWPYDVINTENLDDSNGSCCIWDSRFTEVHEVFPGLLSCACLMYLILKFYSLPLQNTTTAASYNTLFSFVISSFLRVAFTDLPRSQVHYHDMAGSASASLESLLVVYEIEMLTHLCIDRYVTAKYIYNGWEVTYDIWNMYNGISLFFALLYSNLPYYNYISSYTYDFDCASWTMDMVLPCDNWLKLQTLALYFLKAVKPLIVMFWMMLWAQCLEKKFTKEMNLRSQQYFSQVVTLIATSNIMCWTARGLLVGKVLLDQVLVGQIQVPSTAMLRTADFMYSIAPVCTVAIILGANYYILDGQFFAYNIVRFTIMKKKESALAAANVPPAGPIPNEEREEEAN